MFDLQRFENPHIRQAQKDRKSIVLPKNAILGDKADII